MHDDSILNSIKKLLGLDPSYDAFDQDIIICINTTFSILNQLGAGPVNGYSICDSSAKWSDYLNGNDNLNTIISYMHLKVKTLFDPPTNSSVMESYNKTISELEWRINIESGNS